MGRLPLQVCLERVDWVGRLTKEELKPLVLRLDRLVDKKMKEARGY